MEEVRPSGAYAPEWPLPSDERDCAARHRAGDADRFIGLTLSNVTTRLLALDELTADALEIAEFERDVRRTFASMNGIEPLWYVSYHMRVGVK